MNSVRFQACALSASLTMLLMVATSTAATARPASAPSTARPTESSARVGAADGPGECPPGHMPEGEPDCFDGYVDEFNGGLNSTPPVFSPITCEAAICGRFGTFVTGGSPLRDTDWYALTLDEPCTVTWQASASVGHVITTLDAAGFTVGQFAVSTAGESISVTNALAAGDWYFFISTAAFSDVPCDSSYVASLSCDCSSCAITNTDPACAGTIGNEHCGPTGTFGYQWTVAGDATISGPADQQCVMVDVGTKGPSYTLSLTLTQPGGPPSTCVETIDIIEAQPPCSISNPGAVPPGTVGNEHCGPVGLATYEWSVTGDGTIAGPSDQECVSIDAGTAGPAYAVTLIVTNAAGCAATCSETVPILTGTLEVTCVVDHVCPPEPSGSSSSGASRAGSDGASSESAASGSSGSSASSQSSGGSESSCSGGDRVSRVSWIVDGAVGAVMVTAVIDIGCEEIPVRQGQLVDVTCPANGSGSSGSANTECSATVVDGILTIVSDSAQLVVTVTDEAGQTAECTTDLCDATGESSSGSSGSSGSNGSSGGSSS
ncbi:MAG: hypothetical protein GY715_03940 [Planctomycetes bacterium]|nr:hypothetical protein [Planctomycetota bacterium]